MTLNCTPISAWEQEIAERALAAPPPSSAAWRVYEILGDAELPIEDVVEAARSDPGFAAELIRFANTAQFGRGGIATIPEAVSAVGHARLRGHALAFAFRRVASEPLEAYGLSSEQFFRKSVACAAALRALGGHGPEAETRYTIGLLHALGELFIAAAIASRPRARVDLRAASSRARAAAEERALGLNQAQIAGLVLRRWRFPEEIVGPIEQQFAPEAGSPHFEAAQALVVARYVAGKVLDAERSGESTLRSADHLVYGGRALSQIFGYALEESAALSQVVA